MIGFIAHAGRGRSRRRAWSAGSDIDTMQRLIAYWAGAYDWRAHEAALNQLPHYAVEVAGKRVHFLHSRGERTATFRPRGR